MPQGLNQQPRRVAARPRARGQRLLRRLDAGLHSDDVTNPLLQLRIEIDQEIDRVRRLARDIGQIFREQWPGLDGLEIGRQFVLEIVGVEKRKTVDIRFDEKTERVDYGHLRREIDLDLDLGGLFGKYKPGQPVALRILLPVHEMVRWRNLERIAQDRRAGVRRGPQPNGLRAEVDRTVIFVVRDVM